MTAYDVKDMRPGLVADLGAHLYLCGSVTRKMIITRPDLFEIDFVQLDRPGSFNRSVKLVNKEVRRLLGEDLADVVDQYIYG